MACPDCFRGGVTLEHPKGAETRIHGLDTYVAQPPSGTTPKGVIVYIADAFGWRFPNNRVLADHYAQRGGYLVYVPDFMGGGAIPAHGLTLMDAVMAPSKTWADTLLWKPWYVLQMLPSMASFMYSNRPQLRRPLVVNFLTALRTSPPPFETTRKLRIGAAGFCWGGKHCFWLAADDPATRVARHGEQETEKQPLIDCAFTAHPSFIDVPADVEAVKLPLSVAIGDTDMAMKSPLIQQMKQILEGKPEAASGRYEANIIPGAKHGFAVRSHPDDEHEMACARRAEDQAIAWFDKWLARE
ncbi:Alpha/Beta hydrolase protein [Microdochium bolleyi]|uniref:Alpha/Beta hydrolase protein n=1 Tax=Microdochium bolleyi TaxID=196109 RepID=A0A136ILN4_9PEZI|nr:Alpha/Beta hydrolase protein [Microdochium bolleyi]